jgi:hypothetical protein
MKKIVWESWNEKEIELSDIDSLDSEMELPMEELEQIMQMESGMGPIFSTMGPNVIQTPFGSVDSGSVLKPSNRWQCWLAYTNFDLTFKVSDKIKTINGVEALKVMSRYTFCVGVGKLFNFTSVRKEIENAICKQ